jgi:hypothetical protein
MFFTLGMTYKTDLLLKLPNKNNSWQNYSDIEPELTFSTKVSQSNPIKFYFEQVHELNLKNLFISLKLSKK